MRLDPDEVRRSFPWVKEVWLFGGAAPVEGHDGDLGVLVISAVPPREVLPGQRSHLLSQLQSGGARRIDLRLTTSQQLAKWLGRKGRFASTFREQAVKLFERPVDAPDESRSAEP